MTLDTVLVQCCQRTGDNFLFLPRYVYHLFIRLCVTVDLWYLVLLYLCNFISVKVGWKLRMALHHAYSIL